MLKYDRNLADIRELLVPGSVTEDEFWRNYFYLIELAKKQLGLQSRLVNLVSSTEKQRRVKAQAVLLNESRLQVEATEKGVDVGQLEPARSKRVRDSGERLDEDKGGIEMA